MYESSFRGMDILGDDAGPEAVSYHRGGASDFLDRHRDDATRAQPQGLSGVRALAPHLFQRIADARTLFVAWEYLAEKGGQSPGPNGDRYRDFTKAESWELCRCLANALRSGHYRPGPEKVVWVDKDSGHGQRPLVLLNIEDRVMQRAIVLIVQPVLNPLFDAHSFGFRPKRGHWHVLALVEKLTLAKRRRWWVAEDIKDAFQHVPVTRLLQIVRKFLPDDDLLGLLQAVLPGQSLPGLRQGGSLSPLMLNLYLHHCLDRPWRGDHPRIPLLRMADDLLVLALSEHQASHAYAELQRLLVPAGMPLKGTLATAVQNLDAGTSANWLGMSMRKVPLGLAFAIAERSWLRLEQHLALAHTKNDAPLRAMHTVQQWLSQRGPCFPWIDRDEVCQRIFSLAQRHAFEEMPGAEQLKRVWQMGHVRWCKVRKSVRAAAATPRCSG